TAAPGRDLHARIPWQDSTARRAVARSPCREAAGNSFARVHVSLWISPCRGSKVSEGEPPPRARDHPAQEDGDEVRTAIREPGSLQQWGGRGGAGPGRRGRRVRLDLDGGARGGPAGVSVPLSVLSDRSDGLGPRGLSHPGSSDLAG